MAEQGPHLAVDNTPDPEESGPTNGNGGNGDKLRSDFHRLELGMERLRSDVVTNLAGHKLDTADLKLDTAALGTKLAEAKVSIITIILIAIGVSVAVLGLLLRAFVESSAT